MANKSELEVCLYFFPIDKHERNKNREKEGNIIRKYLVYLYISNDHLPDPKYPNEIILQIKNNKRRKHIIF